MYHKTGQKKRTTASGRNDRRVYERIAPDCEAIVYNEELLGHLIDISGGGLSFCYAADQGRPKDIFLDLTLLCSGERMMITKLFCQSVSDFALCGEGEGKETRMRRRCVRFNTLSPDQHLRLQYFLTVARQRQPAAGGKGGRRE